MEDTLQRVFSVLVAVIIFFLLPLYIAFEKKDDISYSLALKITSNFVDNVKNKGYLSKDMYDNFISNLAVTGNDYDIKMEHLSKKYYPVIYSYKDNTYKEIEKAFDYSLYKESYEESNGTKINVNGREYTNLVLAYDLSTERNTEKQILNYIEGNISAGGSSGIYEIDGNKAIYPMSVGDEFTVIIKNTNVTVATVLFNTLTFGANNSNTTKIYINYGGTVQNEEYNTTVLEDYVGSELSNIKYEKSELVLWYDAFYNTNQGADIYSTAWSDLSQNNNNGIVSTKSSIESFWNTTDGYVNLSNSGKTGENITSINCGRIEEILNTDDVTDKKFTIECVYKTDRADYGLLFGNLEYGGFGVYAKNNKLRIQYKSQDDKTREGNYYTTVDVDAKIGELNTITFVYNSGNAYVYVNGLNKTTISNVKMSPSENDTVLRIGANPTGGDISGNTEPYVGKVSSFRVYNKALSDAQVKKNYDIDISRFE